jgi:hypothetical protein
MKCKIHLILFAFLIALSSCNIEKRVYQSGYYISGRHANQDDIEIKKRIKPIALEESMSCDEKLEAASVKTVIDSTLSIAPEYSDPIIEENISTNPHPINESLSKSYSDSIPDEGKILLAKYERNHKIKDKIAKIAFYPIALLALCWFTALFLFVPIIYGLISYDGDPNIKRFFIVCLSAIAFTIPLLIAYFILSIITKKQRRKLKRMGLIK